VALITGAGRGIGQVIARVLAAKGMTIGVNDADEGLAASAAEELRRDGFRAVALPGDVTRKADVEAMVDRTETELGPLWLLVNNAGTFYAAPTVDMTEESWDREFAVDSKGVFLCSQAALRRMIPRRGGRVVNVSSIAGLIVRTGQIGYCSAKAAVVHFSRCLAVEVAEHGITVNCLCPGMTRTEMLVKSAREHGRDLDAMVALIPDGRMAQPEDHAHLVAYLASEEAAHVTGQVISVDGAQSLYHPLAMRSS
jgi:NAD(P)-dependent dehydrogenase (short-subunit alcohol dehydrogenase family)